MEAGIYRQMPVSQTEPVTGHPVLFGFALAREFDGQILGGYPKGFLGLAYRTLGVSAPDRVLHLCSGSVRVGITVDIREAMRPRVVADARSLPFRGETFDWVMADPPYTAEYARNLYGTEASFPRPSQIIGEAQRVLRPGGRVGILHFQVPLSRPKHPLKLIGVWGVTTGAGYAIRAWSVFEKPHASLLEEPA